MKLTAEQISQNWVKLLDIIKETISEPRKTKLLEFYKKYEERLMLMPASHKKEYHNAFPGGYVEHVLRVIECSISLYKLWEKMGSDVTLFTQEELIFSALNHDLGKMGDETNESYIPQTDSWRKEKLGEDYTFNTFLPFASVPDRGLFLLQSNGINYTFNEMIAIQTHDGIYDEGNKKYLMGFQPEQKPRNSLPYILHQADLMAARIEFEREWLPKFNSSETKTKIKPETKPSLNQKALKSVGSNNLKSLMEDL